MAEPHDMQILVSLAHDMETLAIVSALVTILTMAMCDLGIKELSICLTILVLDAFLPPIMASKKIDGGLKSWSCWWWNDFEHH